MKKKVILIIAYLVIIICGTGITYSLFTSNTKLIANQKIAKFIFQAEKTEDAEETETISLPITDLNPGDEKTFQFKVTNNLNDKTSDVTINYQLIIKTYHFMPLEIKLYKNSETETPLIECDESQGSRDSTTNQLICNSTVQKMLHSQKIDDSYKLVVNFPKEYNSVVYSDLVDYIDIEIKSWQSTDE